MKKHNVRRLLVLVLVVALCLLCGAAAQPNPKEIHIYSADDFVQLSKSCKLDTYSQGKTVYLDSDVDLSGSKFVPIPTFGGTFEGQGHTVSGLELSGDASHMGLFRYVQAVGTVRDLKVTGNIDAAGTVTAVTVKKPHASVLLNRAARKAADALIGMKLAVTEALNVDVPVVFTLSGS